MAGQTPHQSDSKLEAELERYLKIYSHDPKSIVFAQLGETYRKMGKLDEALGILEEGVKSHPNYPLGHIALGKCLGEKGQTDKAISEFEAALRSNPDNIMAQKMLAAEYRKKNDEPSLVAVYKKLLELSPKDAEARAFLESRGVIRPQEAAKPKPKPFEEKPPAKKAPAVQPKTDGVRPSPQVKPAADTQKGPSDGPARGSLEFYTATLAEIYAKQGLKTEAAEIYEALLKGDPMNRNYLTSLERIKGVVPEGPPVKEAKTLPPEVPREVEKNDDTFIVGPEVDKLKSLLDLVRQRKRGI